MHYIINKIRQLTFYSYFLKIIQYITIQNIITIGILPIYGSWGISFSLLSFLGNFIFLPFLSMYIFLSTLILFLFFFDCVSFSIIYLQKYLLDFWILIMHMLSIAIPCKPIYFINYPWFSYPLCFSVVIFILFLKKININKLLLSLYSSIFLILILIIFSKLPVHSNIKIIDDGNKKYILRKISENSILISFYKKNYKNNINEKKIKYMILPEIRKNFGIDNPLIII